MISLKDKVREIYERESKSWANFLPLEDEFVKMIRANVKSSASVLDIACGGGRLAVSICGYVNKVIAIDFSAKSIELANKLHHKKNVSYRVMDAEKLNFEDESFDAVVSHLAINKASCRANKVFRYAHSILKKNGLLFFKIVDGSCFREFGLEAGYTSSEIKEELESSGFIPLLIKKYEQRFIGKNIEDLMFIERTEIGALLSKRDLTKFYMCAEKTGNYSFNENFLITYARKVSK